MEEEEKENGGIRGGDKEGKMEVWFDLFGIRTNPRAKT